MLYDAQSVSTSQLVGGCGVGARLGEGEGKGEGAGNGWGEGLGDGIAMVDGRGRDETGDSYLELLGEVGE